MSSIFKRFFICFMLVFCLWGSRLVIILWMLHLCNLVPHFSGVWQTRGWSGTYLCEPKILMKRPKWNHERGPCVSSDLCLYWRVNSMQICLKNKKKKATKGRAEACRPAVLLLTLGSSDFITLFFKMKVMGSFQAVNRGKPYCKYASEILLDIFDVGLHCFAEHAWCCFQMSGFVDVCQWIHGLFVMYDKYLDKKC